MITKDEIYERKKFLQDYHSTRIELQKEEQSYYDDTFDVPMIKAPQYISRTGTGAWLVDGPASHIITRNPQVFVLPKKNTDTARGSTQLVNALFNHWVSLILGQSPQPFKEHVRKNLKRGEAWIHPILNEKWEKGDTKNLPFYFLIPDPINIYSSPTEEYGIPEYVCVIYQRMPWQIEMRYPDWKNPNAGKKGGRDKPIEWFEYWDKDSRYFSAGDVPVLKGEVQENIYKFNPWIHSYSGFGDSSPDGKPETLVIGRLRRVKDLLLQECAINSDIDSTIHKFARPKVDVIAPEGSEGLEEELKKNYDMGVNAMNVLPFGTEIKEGTRILPTQEAFQHFYNIRQRIALEAPPIMAGLPSGSSGRQEDIVGYHFIRRFDSVVEATETAFARALTMGKEILKVVPGWLPVNQWLELPDGSKGEKNISEKDLDNTADCEVVLKAADPIEDDRKLMAGRALKQDNLIDWETFLVEYAGYTPEKATEVIEQTIADTVVMQNPMLFQALAEKALENLGMTDYLEKLKAQNAMQGKMQEGLKTTPVEQGARGGEARQFNTGSPEAREMVDMMLSQRGARRSPM